ncbi:MAG: DUF4421 family protein [Bacteroidota bacterium]
MRFLLVFLLPVLPAMAVQDTLRNTYIKPFSHGLIAGPVVKYRYPGVEFTGPDKDFRRMVFRPNSNLTAGIRVNVFGLNIEIGTSVSKGFLNQDRYGTSKARDLTMNGFGRRWFGDVQWVRYQGLYYRQTWADYAGLKVPSRDDLSIRNRSLSFTWIFDPDRFTYRGAYLFRDQQKRSAGSPLVRVTLNTIGFQGNDPLIDAMDAVHFPSMTNVNGVHFRTFGVAAGFCYTWVYKYFFANGTLLAGAAHYWSRYEASGKPDHYDIQFNFISTIGLAAGYNGDRYFAGVNYRGQGFRVNREEVSITGSQNSFVIMAGIRFREHGVMKKRLNDLTPIRNITSQVMSTNQ